MTAIYPKDFYIQLKSLDPFYRARVTVNLQNELFSSEVAIVSCESDKIYQFIGHYFGFENEKEALDISTQKLSHHFKKLS